MTTTLVAAFIVSFSFIPLIAFGLMRPAKPEERKASKVPPGYPLAFVPEGGAWENGIVGVGVDNKGRVKRFYSDEKIAERAKAKFKRIRKLSRSLPKLDRELDKSADKDDRAACALLVRTTGMRPGSERVTGGAKQVFGATTLQAQHVQVDRDFIRFNFVGKGGKDVSFDVQDRALASALSTRIEGRAPEDQLFPGVTDRSMNTYLKGVLGDEFKTKDLRTALATATAQAAVDGLTDRPQGKREAQQLRLRIAEQIAERLGNTRQEVIDSYVDPGVWNSIGL